MAPHLEHRYDSRVTLGLQGRAAIGQVRLLDRTGGVAGVAFVLLLVAAFLSAPAMPVAGTPGPEIVAYVSAHSERLERSWFLVCGPDLFCGAWFLGFLAVGFWDAGASRPLVAVGCVSALIAGALLATAGVTWGLLVYLAPQLGVDSLVLVLSESRHFAEGAICFPVAAAAVAFSLASWNTAIGWRVIAVVGLIAAGLQLANWFVDFAADGITGALGPLSFFAVMVWIAGVAVALGIRSRWFALSDQGLRRRSAAVLQVSA